jgi:hypothetical protein
VLGIEAFLSSHGQIKRGSGKLLREDVEKICLDFEKFKAGELSSYRELTKHIENVSRKLDSTKSDMKSEISSIKAPEKQTTSGASYYAKHVGSRPSHSKSDEPISISIKDSSHQSNHEHNYPAGFKKKDEIANASAVSKPIAYKKPSINQESSNSIWYQPQYLVDQNSGPTAKITQMKPPPVEARSRTMSQEIKKHIQRDSGPSLSVIGQEGIAHSDLGFGVAVKNQQGLQQQRAQRPSSADPRTRYALPTSVDENCGYTSSADYDAEKLNSKRRQIKESRGTGANLPIAPSSEPRQHPIRQQAVSVIQLEHNHSYTREDRRIHPPGEGIAFTVDAQSILMSESQSSHGDCQTPTRQPRNEILFIPAGNNSGSQIKNRPPVAKVVGHQVISSVNNYTSVGAVSRVASQTSSSRNKSLSGSASKPGKNTPKRSNSRDDPRQRVGEDMQGAISQGKQIKQGNGVRNQNRPNQIHQAPAKQASSARNVAFLDGLHNKSADKPVKNYKQVQSRIKDLVEKDRQKWNGNDSKLAGMGVQFSKGLEHVEFLTQGDDCTFRPEDEMISRHEAAEDQRNLSRGPPQNPGGLNRSADTLNISQDESSLTSTKHLLKAGRPASNRASERKQLLDGGYKTQATHSNKNQSAGPQFSDTYDGPGLNSDRYQREDHVQKPSSRSFGGRNDDLNSTGVVGIASKLLNSDIMKRLESRGEQGHTFDAQDSRKGYSNTNPWKRTEQMDSQTNKLESHDSPDFRDEPSFDETGGYPSSREYGASTGEVFVKGRSYPHHDYAEADHAKQENGRGSHLFQRKEDFDQGDYEMNFHETSRASSSQFSAFCPGEDVKSFFKKEFTGDSPALTNGTTTASKDRHMWSKNSGHDAVGDHSYTSSKLTYGPNSTLLEKKNSQRSNYNENH